MVNDMDGIKITLQCPLEILNFFIKMLISKLLSFRSSNGAKRHFAVLHHNDGTSFLKTKEY